MAEFLVSAVIAVSVGAQQPLHPVHQVGLRSFYHQMKVIPHEAIGMHLPTGLFAGFGKRLQEAAPVNVIQEDNLAPVATIHEVINRPRVLDSELASHDCQNGGALRLRQQSVDRWRTDPFSLLARTRLSAL